MIRHLNSKHAYCLNAQRASCGCMLEQGMCFMILANQSKQANLIGLQVHLFIEWIILYTYKEKNTFSKNICFGPCVVKKILFQFIL